MAGRGSLSIREISVVKERSWEYWQIGSHDRCEEKSLIIQGVRHRESPAEKAFTQARIIHEFWTFKRKLF